MHSVGVKRFDLRSLLPTLRSRRLLLVSTNFMSLVFIFLLFLNSACRQGWIGNGTLCYKSFRSPKTWKNAKKECEKWNATLVKIESREENDFIKTKVTQTNIGDDYWIGLSDSDREADWKWTDGTQLAQDGYKNWADNQPDNHLNNEHCVIILIRTKEFSPELNGKWNDVQCSNEMYFICQSMLIVYKD